jgi:hypothetical protein
MTNLTAVCYGTAVCNVTTNHPRAGSLGADPNFDSPAPTAACTTCADERVHYVFDGSTGIASLATKWLLLWRPIDGYLPSNVLPKALNRPDIWVQVELPQAKLATDYAIVSAGDQYTRDPRDWHLLGSNDNVSWTHLDSRCAISWPAADVPPPPPDNTGVALKRLHRLMFKVAKPGTYKFYRVFIENNNGNVQVNASYNKYGNGMTQIGEIELYSQQ